MNFVLSNGTTYIAKKSNGKFVATYDMGLAIVFDSEQKAQNALIQLPRGYKTAGYKPKRLTDTQKTNQEKDLLLSTPKRDDKQNAAVKVRREDSEWLASFKKNLLTVERTLGNIKKNYSAIYEELNSVSDEIEDLLHAIEIKNVNACRANKLEVELREARRKRRECKDAMTLIELAMKLGPDDWSSGQMSNLIGVMDHCVYHPKVRPDLFE